MPNFDPRGSSVRPAGNDRERFEDLCYIARIGRTLSRCHRHFWKFQYFTCSSCDSPSSVPVPTQKQTLGTSSGYRATPFTSILCRVSKRSADSLQPPAGPKSSKYLLTMWSNVTPASAAAATTLALLDEYVIFNLTADSSGQLYTNTDETRKIKKRGVGAKNNAR